MYFFFLTFPFLLILKIRVKEELCVGSRNGFTLKDTHLHVNNCSPICMLGSPSWSVHASHTPWAYMYIASSAMQLSAAYIPQCLTVAYAAGVMAKSLLNMFFGSYLALICESRSKCSPKISLDRSSYCYIVQSADAHASPKATLVIELTS